MSELNLMKGEVPTPRMSSDSSYQDNQKYPTNNNNITQIYIYNFHIRPFNVCNKLFYAINR